MIEESELVVARERREPKRQLREIDGERILVDAVEAPLRHEPAGVKLLVLVRRDRWPRSPASAPKPRQAVRRIARQASTRNAPEPIAGIADLQIEHLFRPRVRPEPLEGRLQRVSHDRLGEAARRVVAAGAAALVGRLQDRRCRRQPIASGRAALVDDADRAPRELGRPICAACTAFATLRRAVPRSASSFRNLIRSLPFFASSVVEIDEDRRAVVLARLDRERRARSVSTVKPITVS